MFAAPLGKRSPKGVNEGRGGVSNSAGTKAVFRRPVGRLISEHSLHDLITVDMSEDRISSDIAGD